MEWAQRLVESLGLKPWQLVLLSVGVFVVSFVGSLAAVTFVLIKLPPTYFHEHHPRAFLWAERHPLLRWSALAGKNLLGLLLIVIGLFLSIPGVPGQGFLTILIGVMLLNFPMKHRFERKLVNRPSVLQAINGLRGRFGKPPLVLEGDLKIKAAEEQIP